MKIQLLGILILTANLPDRISRAGGGSGEAATPPAAAPAATSPVPLDEKVLFGFIDLGYRWVEGPYGSTNTYRSVVDLGSGPKMLGTEFTILDPGKRLFDRIAVRAYNWGDDPIQRRTST